MPRALQTIAGFTTAAGAGTNIVTPAPGDTFQVPSFDLSSKAYIENVYFRQTAADWIRIRSPRLHDNNQGLRIFTGGANLRSVLPYGMNEVLYPSDTPIVEIDSTGAGSSVVLATYGYTDLPGVQPRLAMWSDVQPRIVHVMGVEVDVTSGAIGAWGNGQAINGNFDNFEAGADYAWLGYMCSAPFAGLALSGKDTGNLKVGAPGDNTGIESPNFFITMSEVSGRPSIPIIAANNKGATLLQSVDNAAATAAKVTLYLAQLA